MRVRSVLGQKNLLDDPTLFGQGDSNLPSAVPTGRSALGMATPQMSNTHK